jgi:hypothetical protein
MQTTGVQLSSNLPLKWHAKESFTGEELAEWMHGNIVVLQALASLESIVKDSDTESRIDHNVARLEAKIDLTLKLVGELLRRQTPLPAAVPMALSSEAIAWQSTQNIFPYTKGVVWLYLSPRLPWPLMLPVEVIGTQDGKVRAKLAHVSEEAQEWLDRTLFRHHRRAVHARSK